MAVGIDQSSVGVLTCCGRLGSGSFRGRGLVRRWGVLRRALGLNLLCVEDTIRAVSTFNESLRVVFERIWRRLGAPIRNLEFQALFIDLEIRASALSADAARNHKSGDAQPLGMCLIAHSLQLFHSNVVAFALLNTGKREIGHGTNDHYHGDAKTKISTGGRHGLRVVREHGVFKDESG